ncbi:alpha/beta hydrolase [Paenibacillus tengchongensis]|uniref:alpha/beta hydrolase n=1 Tax=Paenibacillus tengchongensis TaxID=2608684 RepID=UPI00124C8884|nr:alpha/beta hydrolase-fold protein [Paenibacillus tengchongensis]
MNGRMKREEISGRSITVYTPPSYGKAGMRYPVVYLQDDGDMMKDTFNYLEHLFLSQRLPELIMVGVCPQERNHEYTPWPAPPLRPGAPGFGGRGADYVQELALTLKPAIDRRYDTLPGAEHTAIIGGSLGGLVALHAGYLYPGVFGRQGLLSASFWYEGVLEYMGSHILPERERRIYMYVGELEGCYKTNVQKEMVPNTRKARALLLEQGFGDDKLLFETHPEGTHDTVFFSLHFPRALLWLFGQATS